MSVQIHIQKIPTMNLVLEAYNKRSSPTSLPQNTQVRQIRLPHKVGLLQAELPTNHLRSFSVRVASVYWTLDENYILF